jgi:hypothetical protein
MLGDGVDRPLEDLAFSAPYPGRLERLADLLESLCWRFIRSPAWLTTRQGVFQTETHMLPG